MKLRVVITKCLLYLRLYILNKTFVFLTYYLNALPLNFSLSGFHRWCQKLILIPLPFLKNFFDSQSSFKKVLRYDSMPSKKPIGI